MRQKERHEKIFDYLKTHKVASYNELEQILDVSIMTVRRDIDILSNTGQIVKTIGGAQFTGIQADLYESPVISRLSENNDEKKAIAAEAIKLINPGESIYLDGSSTCLELAKMIVDKKEDIIVVMNSLLLYTELVRGKNISIFCLGGQHDPASYSLTGPQTESQAKEYFVDKAFFSTKGFKPDEGTFESSVQNFRIKQIIAKTCSNNILLVDHSKFFQKGLCKVLDIAQINTVITDDITELSVIEKLKTNIKDVKIVKVE